jgi:integrase
MPRIEIAGYWLSQRPRSRMWYATWFDKRTRQTKRRSLGVEDIREAEVRLAEFVVRHSQPRNVEANEAALATVLLRYWHGHASKIASHVQARIALALWNEFWAEATISELSIARREEFARWLKDRGYKNAYVSRVLSVGRAAVNRAWKRQEITSAPFIIDEPDRSDEKAPYRLTRDEMRRLLATAREWPHLFVFCMIALNTLARPDAVLDLSPFQVDLEDRWIDLNPRGRKQTKKYRPVVPITDTLLPFVTRRDVSRFVNWHGKPIKSIKKVFATMVRAAGLPSEITPYSLRHTMAAELRRRGVPMWEVEGLLGHKAGGITETYARFDPDYLSKGSRAIDAYFADLGLTRPESNANCVPLALHSAKSRLPANSDLSRYSEGWMVGATGIEPVTPTMST